MNMDNQQFCQPKDISKHEPGLTVGGFRHLQFFHGEKLEAEGVVCRFGRKLLINLPKLREFIANGGAKNIAGKGGV
jgi:hypothetical protein